MPYILSDLSRTPFSGIAVNKKLLNICTKWIDEGNAVFYPPSDQCTVLNFTGNLGAATGIFYSTMFQLRKWEFNVKKAGETIEVSPVHQQYYQLTQKKKEDLESRIKKGLASASQSVADLELLEHDLRKYQDFIKYFGMEYNEESGSFENTKNNDEHTLKANFLEMQSPEDTEKNSKLKDIPIVEKKLLEEKWKAYNTWKEIFIPEVKKRYVRIQGLVNSREKSVEEYKEWLKPVVARHKLIEEGFENPKVAGRYKTLFVNSIGQAISYNNMTVWAWKSFAPSELQKASGEIIAKARLNKLIDPYDKWTRDNIIFHPEHGIQATYPWVTKELVDQWVKEIKSEYLSSSNKLYYIFFVLSFDRTNIKFPTGSEIEDVDVGLNSNMMSQNILLAKLLEIKAQQAELERHINAMLGIQNDIGEFKTSEIKKPGLSESFDKFFNIELISLKRKGPYETDFEDRITKFYLKQMGGGWYATMLKFIKDKVGFGEISS